MSNVTNLNEYAELSAGEMMVLEKVLPVMDSIEEQTNESVDLAVFILAARRMAVTGYTLKELNAQLNEHFNHQLQWSDKCPT